MLSCYLSTNHGHLGHHSVAILRREYRSKYTSSASRSKASQGRQRGWSYTDGRKPGPSLFQEPSTLRWTLSTSTVSIQCCEMCGKSLVKLAASVEKLELYYSDCNFVLPVSTSVSMPTGNGDGILPCDRCFGAGIVPTEVGLVALQSKPVLATKCLFAGSLNHCWCAAWGSWCTFLHWQCTMQQLWWPWVHAMPTLCGFCTAHATSRPCGRSPPNRGHGCAHRQHQLAQAIP